MLELRTAYSRSFCGSRDEIIFIETDLLEKHRKKSHPPCPAPRRSDTLDRQPPVAAVAGISRLVSPIWRTPVLATTERSLTLGLRPHPWAVVAHGALIPKPFPPRLTMPDCAEMASVRALKTIVEVPAVCLRSPVLFLEIRIKDPCICENYEISGCSKQFEA